MIRACSLRGSLDLGCFADHVDERTQRCRHLPVTGEVEAQAGPGRAPVLQQRHHSSRVQRCTRERFGNEGDAEAVDRGGQHQVVVVETQGAGHVDGMVRTVSFELPAVALAAGQALPDAAVRQQCVRPLRTTRGGDIGLGRDGEEADIGAERNRDHVLRDRFGEVDAGIKPSTTARLPAMYVARSPAARSTPRAVPGPRPQR
ncbi:hypothetical protein J2W68_003370 [Luteimonas terrae]|uniref:Uncharacterized protein n=1 Tax=Luteimonas terrae TaxID=1530191 RepID=A0ABU1Y0S3_9GAMM|nr:hypothetical protein [Luteimonas terrae]